MFGFLGNHFGMFQLFFKLASTGEIYDSINGRWYLYKTHYIRCGLIIGLLAYIAFNYLNTQIDKTANRMEAASAEFVDILQEPTR